MNKKKFGLYGEKIAADYLISRGFIIIKKNYSCKFGEIDIITKKNNNLIFVEVKARKNLNCGNPAEAVNLKKQNKIKIAALDFISNNKLENNNFRFDVIEIIMKPFKINHIISAFEF